MAYFWKTNDLFSLFPASNTVVSLYLCLKVLFLQESVKGLNFIRGSVCLAGKDGSLTVSEARVLLLAVRGAVGVTRAHVTPSFDLSACKLS